MAQERKDPSALRLHEALLLLALRDEEGTIERRAGSYSYAIGGAILTELSLAGRIRIGTDRKKLVDVVDKTTLHDPVLDDALGQVVSAKRRRSAARWVAGFAGMKRLRHRIAEGLCTRGILRSTEDTVLLFFRRKAYPTTNPAPERRLVEQMRRAIFDDEPVTDPTIATLITLGNATGLLAAHFDRKKLKRNKQRLEKIASGDMIGGATAEAVQAAQAAAMVAITASAAASSAIH
jgi:hypothetical protein